MPLLFGSAVPLDRATACAACHFAGDGCMEDLRSNPIHGRDTTFRISQDRIVDCAFGAFVPGCDGDPEPDRPFRFYREIALENSLAGAVIGYPGAFRREDIRAQAKGKVDGDIYELLQAAVLWNAASDWNAFMDTGHWPAKSTFSQPVDAVATPLRRIAIVKLPRGYDSTALLTPAARATYEAFQVALKKKGMDLRLSSPDIVGLRIPEPMPESYRQFLAPLPNINKGNLNRLQHAYNDIAGTIEGRNFLFAIAVKTSTRSDRLYQPLFEANVLKFIVGFVLRGSALRFRVHMESMRGADVVGAYNAASLYSLMMGGEFSKAVDCLYHALSPRETGQAVLNTLTDFAI